MVMYRKSNRENSVSVILRKVFPYYNERGEEVKRIILTMDLAPGVITTNNRNSFLNACHRWGASYVEIKNPLHKPHHAFHEKLFMDKHVPDGSRVIWFDGDSVIRRDCPNPFAIIPKGHLGTLRATGAGTAVPYTSAPQVVAAYCKRGGYEFNMDNYLSGGLLLFDLPRHRPFFDRARAIVARMGWNPRWELSDQLPFSLAAQEVEDRLFIPQMLSVQGLPIWNDWSPEMKHYVLHAAGPCPKKTILNHTNWECLSSEKRIDWPHGEHSKRWNEGKPIGGLKNLHLVMRETAQLWHQTVKLVNPKHGFAAWHIGQIAYYNKCKFFVEGELSKIFKANMKDIPYIESNEKADLTFTLEGGRAVIS